jgi:hypothetical protein
MVKISRSDHTDVSFEGDASKRQYSGRSVIVFDWDDTLFPTSHIFEHCAETWQQLCNEAMQPGFVVRRATCSMGIWLCLQTAASLLREAASLGEVCVVTMAAPGWVEACCNTLMPELLEVMKKLRIEVIYARETMPGQDGPESAEEFFSFSQVCRRRAMERTLRQMSRQASRQLRSLVHWRSVLTIGRCYSERLALQELLKRDDIADLALHLRHCNCKAVKLTEQPQLTILLKQLRILVTCISKVLRHAGDLDIHFEELATKKRCA